MTEKITVNTTRFGTLEADKDGVITLTEDLLGFSGKTRYFLLNSEENGPFTWLQSAEDPNLAFVLIDPRLIDSNYRVPVDRDLLNELKITDVNQCMVYVIVTLAKDPLQVTANLLGPVIINPHDKLGRQVVLTDPKYTTRHKLLG